MKYHNVVMTVEFIVADDELNKDNISIVKMEKELINQAKDGRWIHVSAARIVHTVEEK